MNSGRVHKALSTRQRGCQGDTQRRAASERARRRQRKIVVHRLDFCKHIQSRQNRVKAKRDHRLCQLADKKSIMNYRRPSIRLMSVPCEISMSKTGNMPTVCFNASRSPPAPFASRSLQNFLRSISMQDQFRRFYRSGARKMQETPCCLHVRA